jgi:hypothetical protein
MLRQSKICKNVTKFRQISTIWSRGSRKSNVAFSKNEDECIGKLLLNLGKLETIWATARYTRTYGSTDLQSFKVKLIISVINDEKQKM